MDMDQLAQALYEAGCTDVETLLDGALVAHAEMREALNGRGLVTRFEITVLASGMVDIERTKTLEAPERTVVVAGSVTAQVTGHSQDVTIFSSIPVEEPADVINVLKWVKGERGIATVGATARPDNGRGAGSGAERDASRWPKPSANGTGAIPVATWR